jgi:hypothetical protein
VNIREQLHKARHGRLYCFGGGGGDSNANTTTTTTNHTTQNNTDQSMMGGDNAVGVNGVGNIVDKSVVNNTAFNDSSNRSTNFFDASDRSTSFVDSSNRSSTSNTTYSTTDFGAVSKALDGMGQLSSATLNTSSSIVKDGLSAATAQSANSLAVLDKAFNFVAGQSATNAQKYEQVMGFASDAIQKSNDAFANAKDGGASKTVTTVALAAAAVGLALALK